jgi:hypothetical protein
MEAKKDIIKQRLISLRLGGKSAMKTIEQKRKAVEAVQRWRKAHPVRAKVVQKEANAVYRFKHPEVCAANDRRKRANNPELYRALDKAKRAAKPELYRALDTARCRRYQAAKLQRTPKWAEHKKIDDFFAQAQAAREFFGGEWHVDHVYPLQGKWISGLHVHENLQVLPGLENRKKSARVQVEFRKDMRDLLRAA